MFLTPYSLIKEMARNRALNITQFYFPHREGEFADEFLRKLGFDETEIAIQIISAINRKQRITLNKAWLTPQKNGEETDTEGKLSYAIHLPDTNFNEILCVWLKYFPTEEDNPNELRAPQNSYKWKRGEDNTIRIQLSMDIGPRGIKYLFLFVRVNDGNQNSIKFLCYELERDHQGVAEKELTTAPRATGAPEISKSQEKSNVQTNVGGSQTFVVVTDPFLDFDKQMDELKNNHDIYVSMYVLPSNLRGQAILPMVVEKLPKNVFTTKRVNDNVLYFLPNSELTCPEKTRIKITLDKDKKEIKVVGGPQKNAVNYLKTIYDIFTKKMNIKFDSGIKFDSSNLIGEEG